MNDSAKDISDACDALKTLLLEKNASYGDSATNPLAVFSKATAEERLGVHIDDKLTRVVRGHEYPGDDTVTDLAGFFVLLGIARRRAAAASVPEAPEPQPDWVAVDHTTYGACNGYHASWDKWGLWSNTLRATSSEHNGYAYQHVSTLLIAESSTHNPTSSEQRDVWARYIKSCKKNEVTL